MKERWNDLGRRIGVKDMDAWTKRFREIEDNYEGIFRLHHNLDHIEHCLGQLKVARPFAKNIDAIETAIWFHDVFYVAGKKDNEERSADFARDVLVGAGVGVAFADEVHRLVMATKHDKIPEDIDGKLMVDIDLSVLGSSWDRYEKYADRIKKEHAAFSESEFAEGRMTAMGALLDRPRIYLTRPFYDLYEQQARDNIGRELMRISAEVAFR